MEYFVWIMLVINILSIGLGLGKLGQPKTGVWGAVDIITPIVVAVFAAWALYSKG